MKQKSSIFVCLLAALAVADSYEPQDMRKMLANIEAFREGRA
ncbi:MAG: hypothetical protein ACRD45_03905 [Bryobacteraceae bacterium]